MALLAHPDEEYLQQNNAGNILALLGSLGSLAVIVVTTRLYVRFYVLKLPGWDDYTILAATLFGLGMYVCFVGETYYGLGRHYQGVTPEDTLAMMKWLLAHSICATSAICLTKVSVGFFLLRLAPKRSWRVFLWITIIFLTAYTLASLGTIIFACVPVQAQWDLELAKTARCFSHKTFVGISLWNAGQP
ncbi:hypothetical protein LTS10_013082 [Elasticomyces elasticus]|nr:hypothetical protein LTS10_013082 [Elasticomyces elasticus]